MKLYIVEAPVKDAEPAYWARTWVASKGDASAARAQAKEGDQHG